ncbi:MAG: MarR family transcriptional regulator [Candidatus Eremiobacteraeota bacterium]|nr:MarR family transcriptional regulator [Candidatus Eremiobacteraeota bacterium]
MLFPMISEEIALAMGLGRAEAALRRRMEALGAGIGYRDFLLLHELYTVQGERLRVSDLAKRLVLTPSGVTRALLPLEKIGLVERIKNERDARSSFVALTPAGHAKIEEAIPSAERIVSETFERALNPLDRVALIGFFERLGYL